MTLKFSKHAGAYYDHRSQRAYEVIAPNGAVLGVVRHIDHNRFGDRWKAYTPNGTEVCEATSRKSAAESLLAGGSGVR